MLEEAFQSMYIGKTYHIPYQFSLSYQIERGVREGVIEKVKAYLERKQQTIPPKMHSSFLSRLSDLLKEGYTLS